MLACMESGVAWRSKCYDTWPYTWILRVHPSLSRDHQARTCQSLWRAHLCDIDRDFCEKLRVLYPTWREAYDDVELTSATTTWSRKGKLCNMHLERDLASIKMWSSMKHCTQKKVIEAERLCACGYTHTKQPAAKIAD